MSKIVQCPECSGLGKSAYSCCGDVITGNDYPFCPSCREHCDTDPNEECGYCDGTGVVDLDVQYKGFTIECICPPIPSRKYDYAFAPLSDDEPDDDGRYAHPELHGFGETIEECRKQIDQLLIEAA